MILYRSYLSYSWWEARCSHYVLNLQRRPFMWFPWQLLIRGVNTYDNEKIQNKRKRAKRGCVSSHSEELMFWWLCLWLLVMLRGPKGPPPVTVQAQWAAPALLSTLVATSIYPHVSTTSLNTRAHYYTLLSADIKDWALLTGRQAVSFPPALSVTLQTGESDTPGSENFQSKLLILLGSMPPSLPPCLPVNLFPLTKSKKAETCGFHHTDIGRVSSEWMNRSCIATANLSAASWDAWLTPPDWSI